MGIIPQYESSNEDTGIFLQETVYIKRVFKAAKGVEIREDLLYQIDDLIFSYAQRDQENLGDFWREIHNILSTGNEIKYHCELDGIVGKIKDIISFIACKSQPIFNDFWIESRAFLYLSRVRGVIVISFKSDNLFEIGYRTLVEQENEIAHSLRILLKDVTKPIKFLALHDSFWEEEEHHWSSLVRGNISEEELFKVDGALGFMTLTNEAFLYLSPDILEIAFSLIGADTFNVFIQKLLSPNFTQGPRAIDDLIEIGGKAFLYNLLDHVRCWRLDLHCLVSSEDEMEIMSIVGYEA